MPKIAKLTGRTIDHPSGTFYEAVCVHQDCQLGQYHRPGMWSCILCGTAFVVQPIHLVPPGKEPEITEKPCPNTEENL